ncbi:MAG: hypothetical protein NT096_10080 [Proteobacteria bacterium]|nr:hypothetical protein [Pseudomonadota bacterium]
MEKKAVAENIIEIWKKTGKVNILKSSGRCMIPLFDDGTPLIVRHVQPDEIKIGDIAVFRSFDRTVAHRIIGRFKEDGRLYFLEKRDSGFEPGIIPEDAVIGKVIGIKKRETSLDLEKGIWMLTNTCIGYYWSFFYTLYQVIRGVKKKIFNEKKIPLAGKIYAVISSFLVNAAHFFISLINSLSFPRKKP